MNDNPTCSSALAEKHVEGLSCDLVCAAPNCEDTDQANKSEPVSVGVTTDCVRDNKVKPCAVEGWLQYFPQLCAANGAVPAMVVLVGMLSAGGNAQKRKELVGNGVRSFAIVSRWRAPTPQQQTSKDLSDIPHLYNSHVRRPEFLPLCHLPPPGDTGDATGRAQVFQALVLDGGNPDPLAFGYASLYLAPFVPPTSVVSVRLRERMVW